MKIDAIGSFAPLAQPAKSEPKEGFKDLLLDFVADVNGDLKEASKAQEALLQGKVDNMVELMTTIEKADISLRFATELRNKAIEAYQEIMRMQV
jgi:flagellar hook-basal body complex protein FliE